MVNNILDKYTVTEKPTTPPWELFEEANNYNCYDLYLIIEDALCHGFEVKVFDNKVFFREVTA